MNSGGTGNHWLEVDIRGTKSNRDAIGATIILTTASGRKLYNHVSTSVGFMSSSDKRVHFGLAQETSIKELQIRWPGGAVRKLAAISADQIVKVEEP